MLHPALVHALAAARIEDQQRAAARRHTIRLARRSARGSRRPVDEADRRGKEPGPIGRRIKRGVPRPSCRKNRPDATCVPAPDRRPVTGFTRDCVDALGLAPDHHDLGALAGELDRCCTSIPAGRAGDHDECPRRDSPIRRS
jgi:hypothetical protein